MAHLYRCTTAVGFYFQEVKVCFVSGLFCIGFCLPRFCFPRLSFASGFVLRRVTCLGFCLPRFVCLVFVCLVCSWVLFCLVFVASFVCCLGLVCLICFWFLFLPRFVCLVFLPRGGNLDEKSGRGGGFFHQKIGRNIQHS